MQELKITTEKLPSESVLIKLDGILDSITVPSLETVLKKFLDEQIYRFIFELPGLEMITSTGGGSFINLLHEIYSCGTYSGVLIFVGLKPDVEEVFNIFGLLKFINIAPDKASAIKIMEKVHNGEAVKGLKTAWSK